MHRFRAITTSDIFEARYHRSVGILFAVIGVAQLAVNIGVMLKGSGTVIYLPWQMIFYLVSGLIAGIVVSLVTKGVNPKKLENYYELLRTPVTGDEVVASPCTLPEGSTAPEPRRLIRPVLGLEIPRPSAVSVAGFVVGWALVAGIIGFVYCLVVKTAYTISQPLRYCSLMNLSASGALVAFMLGASQDSFFPARSEATPSRVSSVSLAPYSKFALLVGPPLQASSQSR